jgi:hypothetical protein|nr:MAG TPA: putative integral membrane zinc-ribbon metal-binding protein [Caudoviricetes sp.]
MCEYCHSNPHKAGCPNEPEPKEVYRCKYCEEAILEGEQFVEINDERYHIECIELLSVHELLALLVEIDIKIAEVTE